MADFAQRFGNALQDQFNMLTGNTNGPDAFTDAEKTALADFADNIDKTAQRTYIESGYIRNVKPRFREIWHQQPNVTILIKKKNFCSLSENYRIDFMDEGEKTFMRAAKRLFQNKCDLISAYERLTKIVDLIGDKGVLDDTMSNIFFSAIDTLDATYAGGASLATGLGASPSQNPFFDNKTRAVINTLRKINNYSQTNNFTTWINDTSAYNLNSTGNGTGVFELTLVGSFSTNVSNKGDGNASLTIQDPYNLMRITEQDIDLALEQACSMLGTGFFNNMTVQLSSITERLKRELNIGRIHRGLSSVTIQITEHPITSKKVRCFIDDDGREIIFNYDGGFGGINSKVTIDPSAKTGVSGLNDADEKLLKDIINNTFQILNQKRAAYSPLDISNDPNDKDSEVLRYARDRLYLFFKNKYIIQPIDVVHIFVSSKTTYDNEAVGVNVPTVTSGSGNILGKLNAAVGNLAANTTLSTLSSIFNPTDNISGYRSINDIEKDSVVGPEFPNWLWNAFKNDFTKQAAGTQIFCGPVTNVSGSYSDGAYSVTANIANNMEYFKFSRVNFKPAADAIDDDLYDPLTSQFEQLQDVSDPDQQGNELPHNKKLLQLGVLKGRAGAKLRGLRVTEESYKNHDVEITTGGNGVSFKKIFYQPQGFVYRWKTGIGTWTYSGPKSNNLNKTRRSVKLMDKVFAGQDVMNAISLLITGEPYNYNTFIYAALHNNQLTRDDINNVIGSSSYFRGLLSDIQRNNSIWGNFLPFKKLVMNNDSLNFMASGSMDLAQRNTAINEALAKRSKLFDLYMSYLSITQSAGKPPDTTISSETINQLAKYSNQIFANTDELLLSLQSNKLVMYGDDFSFDTTYTDAENSGGIANEHVRERARYNLRQKTNYLTIRKLWKVKANEDPNLFIVDDQYDINYDIQAFEKRIAGSDSITKLVSDYRTTEEEIKLASNLLGLEVFADSQGNIRAQPPGYNKVPSSVFVNMLSKISQGKTIFPQSLQKIFLDQNEYLRNTIEITEAEIRLRLASIGIITDKNCETALSGNSSKISDTGSVNFKFITTGDNPTTPTGNSNPHPNNPTWMVDSSVYKITKQVNSAKDLEDRQNNPLESNAIFSTISGQTKANTMFDAKSKIALVGVSDVNTNSLTSTDKGAIITRIQMIRNFLIINKGVSPQSFSSDTEDLNLGTTSTKRLQVANEISQFISYRQQLLLKWQSLLRNISDIIDINTDPGASKVLLYPNLYPRKQIPPIIEHMIEDEDNDDYGPGSGKRFIIRDSQIKSITISENKPEATSIVVSGLYDQGQVPPVSDLQIDSNGANGQAAAKAVDYDMWRQYGFMQGENSIVQALSDPETQMVPFANWKLNQERAKIFTAEVQMIGNEYMQASDVVYIESYDLLFYVNSVSHSFSYGSNFSTTLKLSFGHSPGEYIPSMLDIIGKALYCNQSIANRLKIDRNSSPDGYQSLGAVVYTPVPGESNLLKTLVSGSYGDANASLLTNIVLTLNRAFVGSNQTPKIYLRYYFDSKSPYSSTQQIQELSDFGGAIKEWIKNPSTQSNEFNKVLLPGTVVSGGIVARGLDIDDVVVVEGIQEPIPASRDAIMKATELANGNDDNSKFLTALYKNIIDVFFTTEPMPVSTSTDRTTQGPSQANSLNQIALDRQQAVQKEINDMQAAINAQKKK